MVVILTVPGARILTLVRRVRTCKRASTGSIAKGLQLQRAHPSIAIEPVAGVAQEFGLRPDGIPTLQATAAASRRARR